MAEARRYYDPETQTFLPGARCNIEQYEILKRCAEADGDISEWQAYRKDHPDEAIWLCGANFEEVVLKSPAYEVWRKDHEPREMTISEGMRLIGSWDVLDLRGAHLDGADLFAARLDGANLREAYLDGADLRLAHLVGASLWAAHLDGADLTLAHLGGASLFKAHLDGAVLEEAHLDGADFDRCTMRGTDLWMASVSGETVLNHCKIDRRTDATGVPLDAARVEPGLKQLLEYNVRRIAWEQWYRRVPVPAWQEALERFERQKKHLPRHLLSARGIVAYLKRLGVQPFWWVSDYGRVTWRIILTFLFFAAYFGGAYCLYPSCLIVNGEVGGLRGLWHALYFSIVTQTTLGFGDIHANPADWYGQLLLMLQVILGYVLLGTLVTRFAVLFSAGGPAGQFSPRRK